MNQHQFYRPPHEPVPASGAPAFEMDEIFSLQEIFAVVQRHKKLIGACMVFGLICGMIYIFFAQPRFTASTSILIDARQQNIMTDVLGQDFNANNHLIIDSQIEVIRSTKLLEKAAERAGLFDNIGPPPQPGFLGSLKNSILGRKPPSQTLDAEALKRARLIRLNGFRGGLGVARVRGTYVISISYTSTNPKTATDMANLIAEVYLEDELEAQYEASQRANEWLKGRLTVLRSELTRAEQAIETYKEENGLVSTGGTTISEQQLSDLNSSLISARTQSAEAKARYERIQKITESGTPDIATTDLLDNNVISGMHQKYLELSRYASEIKRKHGEEHLAYINLKRQMDDIENIIAKEYQRIAESYKAEYELARSRMESLEKEMDSVIDTSSISRRNAIELRELERRAESTRNLYTKMLDNFNEQTERQSVPIANARVISYAGIPFRPSWPNTRYILIIGMVLGAIAGGALAFLREQFNRFIWKAEELESVIHRTCLGMLPKIAFDGAKLGKFSRGDERRFKESGFNVDGFAEVTALLNKQTGVTTEIMRNIQLAVQFRKRDVDESGIAKVISFVSARPGEGKSITSCFLAKHLAKSGARVLLIDCDFRRPSLTHWFMPNAKKGFYEIASQLGEHIDEDALDRELDGVTFSTGDDPLYFMPAKASGTSIANLNLVSSGQMHRVIQHLQTRYDAIMIDLPPIINIVDARMVASTIDSFVFLAHWGKTERDLVKKALLRAPEVYNKTAGALLTLVDTEKAGSYGYYNYNYYYQR